MITLNGTSGITTPDIASSAYQGGQLAGLRNKIINGCGRVAQRGNVALSAVGTNYYGGADRIVTVVTGFSTASGTITQWTGGSSSTTYGQKLSALTTTGAGAVIFQQRIESVNVQDLNSKTITVTAYLLQNTGSSLNATISIYAPTVKDTFTTTTQIGTDSSTTSIPSGTLTQISKQFTLSAGAVTNGLLVNVNFTGVGAVTSKDFVISDWQLEAGSVATPFEQRPVGLELALCQRYFQSWGGDALYENIGCGNCTGTTTAQIYIPLMATMRVAPTKSESGSFAVASSAGGAVATTSLALDSSGTKSYSLTANVASGLTAGNATRLVSNNSTASRFTLSSEL